ncbi:MAG: transcription termination factor NusA [Pseudomonadota bacterium]
MFQNLNRVLEQVSRDKGIPKEFLVDAIENAFLTVARKKWGYLGELESHYNEEMGEIELFQFKEVSEKVEDENTQMTLQEAKKLDPDAEYGDSLGVKMSPSVFGRIAAQTAKQVIIQKVREAERNIIYEEYKGRIGEIITGIVRRFDRGDLVVDLGRTEAVVPKQEQVQSENFRAGDRIQGFFLRLDKESRGIPLVLSRKNIGLLNELFSMEVPEIAEGVVEIKSAAREPGVRSKIAVYSRDSDVDPVGACVGIKGSRVQSVVGELKGEKIDVVSWDDDPARFVCNAIAPAEVVKVIIREREHGMEVVVPDDQLSLAIGRRGQNVRLAAQLTGWNIDVYAETRIEEMASRARKVLTRALEIDEGSAMIFYSHSFRSIEDIAECTLDEFIKLPGLGQELLNIVHQKSKGLIAEGKSSDSFLQDVIKEEMAAKALVAEEELKLAEKAKAEREEAEKVEAQEAEAEKAKAEKESKSEETSDENLEETVVDEAEQTQTEETKNNE